MLRLYGLPHPCVELPCLPDLGIVRIRESGKLLERSPDGLKSLTRDECKKLTALGLEEFGRLFERRDPHKRIPLGQVVVEEREREPRHERVDPERESGQLDSHRVHVHAEDAAPGHLPSKELGVLDRIARPLLSQVPGRRPAEPREFLPHVQQGTAGQVIREAPLDAVHGADQEVAGAHRDIGDPELEEPPARLPVRHSVEPLEVIG